LAYLEWTLEFRNDSQRLQEARAQIALPTGGFVSRVTLWVDGEEREAAFAARADVRKAYERVVKKQRDPLLVTTNGPDRLILVVDGSFAMKGFGKDVAAAVAAIPEGIPVDVFIASDLPIHVAATQQGAATHARANAAKRLSEFDYTGGCDNVPALNQAWDMVAIRANSAIVWIHGPQPLRMESPETLIQKHDRRRGTVRLYSVETAPGKNVVIESLGSLESLRMVPRLGELRPDLERLFSSWRTNAQHQVSMRRSADRSEVPELAQQTSMHLVRLWAHDEVLRIARSSKVEERMAAVNLAAAYNLVTPVTGAVALENAQQYQEAGLTPAAPANVPTIPEPETWLLICVTAAILGWLGLKRRNACTQA
jgi:hypothetical protein